MPYRASSPPTPDTPPAGTARPRAPRLDHPDVSVLVRLEHVNVTLQGVPALRDICLALPERRHTALLGANGAGKSTLLRVLRGEQRPDQRHGGTVLWFPPRADVSTLSDPAGDDAPLTGRAMTSLLSPALQEGYVRRGWTVSGEETVIAGLYDDYLLYRQPTEKQRQQCRNLAGVFAAVPLLEKPIHTLSQGQLRCLLLLRALIRKPRLLLLDEAADGLDAENRRLFFRYLEQLAEQPQAPAMVLATHRHPIPDFVTDTIHMDKGRLYGPVTKGEAEQPPKLPQNPDKLPLSINSHLADPEPDAEAFAVSVHTPARDGQAPAHPSSRPDPEQTGGERPGPLVRLEHVTVFIDRVEVLHDINWEIRPGEQWMVTGDNGAGKSTLLRLLMGEELVAWGGSLFRRLPRHGGENPPLELVQRGIRLVSDRLQALYTYNETARDVILSGPAGSIGLYRDPTPADQEEALRCLSLVGMADLADRPFRSLSTGQARRVLLARALAGHPELLLLDEPFSGLDASGRAVMAALLEDRMAAGLQVILVSHNEEDRLPSLTHRAHMEGGRMIHAGAFC